MCYDGKVERVLRRVRDNDQSLSEVSLGWLNSPEDLNAFKNNTHVKKVKITNGVISDTSALQHNTTLTHLNLYGNAIRVIHPPTSLEYLKINSNLIEDIESLEGCESLTHLDLSRNRIVDVSHLSSLTSLTHLNLYMNKIGDGMLPHISRLKHLHYLDLSMTNLTDASCLSTLTSLTHLYLNSNNLKNIDFASELVSLRVLDVTGNKVRTLPHFLNSPNLYHLRLGENKITSLKPLEGSHVQKVSAQYNRITDMTFVSECRQLRILNLIDSPIKSFSSLGRLEKLHLCHNVIDSIDFMTGNTSLLTLGLGASPIKSFEPLRGNTTLRKLYIYNHNHNIDISPLLTIPSLIAIDLEDTDQALIQRHTRLNRENFKFRTITLREMSRPNSLKNYKF